MSAVHTPGPWWVDDRRPSGKLQINGRHRGEGSSFCVATVNIPWEYPEANARLIAAAPDLLALAKQCAEECAECGGTGWCEVPIDDDTLEDQHCDDCAHIRKVITKVSSNPLDAEMDRIMAMSDEEILAQAKADGDDIESIAKRARERVSAAMDAARYRFWRKHYSNQFTICLGSKGLDGASFPATRPEVEALGPNYEALIDRALDAAMERYHEQHRRTNEVTP